MIDPAKILRWQAFIVDNGASPAKYLAVRAGSFVFVNSPMEALQLVRLNDAAELLEPGWRVQKHEFTAEICRACGSAKP